MKTIRLHKMAATAFGEGKRNNNGKTKRDVTRKNESNHNQTRGEPLPSFPFQKVWARSVIVICAAVIVYFSATNKETIFASQKDFIPKKYRNIPCSDVYKSELSRFKECVPQQCGRLVSDSLVTDEEANALMNLAKKGLSFGGSAGGASILDLHSGALSLGQDFINFYKIPDILNEFKAQDFIPYNVVKNKIRQAVSVHFGIQLDSLFLTSPTFFSRLTSTPPMNIHDEYWHKHVDKETYSAFHYTSLVYLNDYARDFFGGRFVFVEADNKTNVIEPRKGRVSAFTSGEENTHYVERVTSGARFAITISFTCDPSKAISDPQLKAFETKPVEKP